jgi:signal transduction histidine kinase
MFHRGSHWLAPIIAVVFLAYWLALRPGSLGPSEAAVFALLAAAIGLSVWMPSASLALIVAVPALQAVGLAPAPDSTTWPAYAAAAVVAFVVGFRTAGWIRYAALPAGVASSLLMAWALTAPMSPVPLEYHWLAAATGGRTDVLLGLVASALFGVFAAAWAFGLAGRALLGRRELAGVLHVVETRWEATDFELRLADDRARIARDVHDALAHSLAVIVSQAQGALALAPIRPAVAVEAVGTIADLGRTALVDVRGLVERIERDDDVSPRETLDDVPQLIDRMRGLGMQAELESTGEPGGLSPSQELAAYRIVQESLTNALKHGGADSSVRVGLVWTSPGLDLTVSSAQRSGSGSIAATLDPGVGIRGMVERARLAGGWLSTDTPSSGEFVVSAHFPSSVEQDRGSLELRGEEA